MQTHFENAKKHQTNLAHEITKCLQENAFDPSLSLEMLGDEFGLSPYYLSRFIAEQTGENMKDYVANLRIEEAKRLLINTNIPLYEIVAQVGYLDVSSFIRKFKKCIGKTPGDYRDSNKKHTVATTLE